MQTINREVEISFRIDSEHSLIFPKSAICEEFCPCHLQKFAVDAHGSDKTITVDIRGGTYTEHLSYYHVNIKDPTKVG